MEFSSNFRALLDLSLSTTSGSLASPRWKESNSIEFAVQHRYVENVITLSASGTLNISISTLGLNQVNFVYVATLEPNRTLRLKFNGDTNGFLLTPPDPTKKVFFCSVSNFTTLTIENTSTTDPATIVYLLVEKV